jgi:hypothetical protein
VKTLLTRLDRFWLPATPPERLAMLRVLVGGYAFVYLVVRTPHLLSYSTIDPYWFQPVGVVSVLPSPLIAPVASGLVIACVLASAAFLAGYRYRVTAPIFAGLLFWVLSYSNSFGKILHTDNLLCLHVVVLALAPAADALSLDARRRAGPPPAPDGRYGWAIQLMCAIAICIYLLAGIAKLENSGAGFVETETLRNYVAFDNVRKIELGSAYSPLGAALLPYPSLFAFLAWSSFALELGAPLALLHRRVGTVWVLLVWGFHWGVLALMAIGFVYQLSGIAFAPFFRVERLLEIGALRRLRSAPAPET